MEFVLKTAYEYLHDGWTTRRLSTGCSVLDKEFGGGIPVTGLTEISGLAGAGKTQLVLRLLLQAQLPYDKGGLNSSAAYLSCGEGKVPIRRLSQLAESFSAKYDRNALDFLDGTLIESIYNVDDFFFAMTHQLPELIKTKNVKLVVVDSIAGLLRNELASLHGSSSSSYKERIEVIFQTATIMKRLSDQFQVCFVIVNQVTTRPGATLAEAASIEPALGLSWTHCINRRFFLTRPTFCTTSLDVDDNSQQAITDSSLPSQASLMRPSRRIDLLFSPENEIASVGFYINDGGVFGVE